MNRKIVCPILQTIAMISDKWKVLILYHLRDGKKRFSELRRSLQGVTQRVLTHQLRALEQDGLIRREVFAEVPPRVEYELTELGMTLIPLLDKFEEWATEHADQLVNVNSGDCTESKKDNDLSKRKEYEANIAIG